MYLIQFFLFQTLNNLIIDFFHFKSVFEEKTFLKIDEIFYLYKFL